ncbi:MAG TPA: hypothetical protein ENI39_02040 [Anaerolineae bacterium]|nr:hypothetical protein [Anaerolineae bacterium]
MKVRVGIWLFGVLVAMLLCIGCVALYMVRAGQQLPGQVTEVERYEEILEGFEGSPWVEHFPERIPPEATDVRLDYLPRLMQGGGHFQLRMRLPREEVGALVVEYRGRAEYRFEGGDWNEHVNVAGGVPTTFYYTSENGEMEFPSTYEVLVLGVGSAEGGYEWNHGYSYGVAIDEGESVVVYWVEYW